MSSNLTAPTIFSKSNTSRPSLQSLPNKSGSSLPATPANLIHELVSVVERMDPDALFPVRQPLEVELGCGDASLTVAYAAMNPGRNFLGVERLMGRIAKLDKKGRRLGLKNLRGVRIESAYLLEWLLPERSVDVLHIYFPDPWPKKKHRRHRLINAGFPALACRVLRPGGRVYLRTDDEDYFSQMLEVFASESRFRAVEMPAELLTVLTDFERDFNAKGIPTLRAAYELR